MNKDIASCLYSMCFLMCDEDRVCSNFYTGDIEGNYVFWFGDVTIDEMNKIRELLSCLEGRLAFESSVMDDVVMIFS